MHASEDQPAAGVPPSVKRIFISYAREDRRWAQERARVARGLGIASFLDLDSIRAGETWPDVLRAEIEKADLAWVGWSRYASQSDWVRHEYEAALARGPGHLRIDLIDGTPLPPALAHIQAEPWGHGSPAADRLIRIPRRDVPPELPLPSILLRPEYAVVPFFGRDALCREIQAWCATGEPFRAALYTGPGGSGKTRLMIEACAQMRTEGWDAGFLDRDAFQETLNAEPDLVDRLLHPRLPRLMVLDYAETRRAQVEALFKHAVRKEAGEPVRVVLLARSEGD